MKEATVSDLLSLSIRKKDLRDPEYSNAKVIKYLHRTKNFSFKIKDYIVDLRLVDMPVIGKLKGTDDEKLDLAFKGEIKVNCTCPDYLYKGFKYMSTQLDYGTRKETRPPNIKNPTREGTVCKHVGHILSNIQDFRSQMLDFMDKSRKTNYKVVRENTESMKKLKSLIERKYSSPREIISELTKRKRIRVSDRESVPSSLHGLKHGDMLILKDKDPLSNNNHNRYLIVKNASNKKHLIGYDLDSKKFYSFLNSKVKEEITGVKSNFNLNLADSLRKDNGDYLDKIDREPSIYGVWN